VTTGNFADANSIINGLRIAKKRKGKLSMLKILHSADWHTKDSTIDESEKCLNHLVETAWNEKPDLIIVAGDLTHRFDVKLDTPTARLLMSTIHNLSQVGPVIIVGGTPYHDGHTPDVLRQLRRPNVIVQCDYPGQIYLVDGIPLLKDDEVFKAAKGVGSVIDAVISMVPAPTKKFLEMSGTMQDGDNKIADGMGLILANLGAQAAVYPEATHIVVGHWSIGGAYTSETQQMIGRDIEISRAQVMAGNPDLVCLGHIHRAQQVGSDPIFYSGSIYSLDAGELEDKGFYIHEFENKNLSSRFIVGPATKRLVISADFTNDDGHIDLAPALYSYSEREISGNHIKITIKIHQDQADQVDQKQIEQFFTSAGAASVKIERVMVPRENVRCSEFFTLKTLREKLVQQARLRGEPEIDAGILSKADDLEKYPAETIISSLPTEQ
jgi:DNA repair exonuclease SbcCD nuclease subunit